MGPESVPMPHQNLSMYNAGMMPSGSHQYPLLYATRHYPNNGEGDTRNPRHSEARGESVIENGDSDVMVEVTLKEEPVD